MSFTHLHVHTEHSKLDGFGKIEELLQRAKELGQTALAVTDHNICSGLWQLQKLAPKYGIKPILGCEFYLDLSEYGHKKRSHLVILAQDDIGLKNMFRLHEWSYVHGFKGRPTITIDVLKRHATGLICMSACIANIIPKSINEGDWETAEFFTKQLQDMFGDNFYLEVQSNTLIETAKVNKGLAKLGYKYGIKLVATNDIHYVLEEDAEVHEVMLAIQFNKKWNDPKRFSFPSNDYWMKSEEEMLTDLQGLTQEEKLTALHNTQEIVDKCNASIEKKHYLPKYHTIPEDTTEERMLRELVTKQYKTEIQSKGLHSQQYVNDVMHELDVIERNGYSGYHLIVQDFVNYARNNGILVGDGRGSGAGCKVAYITGITRVEPNKYGLLFERFLADGREPDYDIDFADNNAIFSYLQSKYGVENVARILSHGTLAPKNVTRRVFSVFDYPQHVISRIAGCINSDAETMEQAYKLNSDLATFREQYPAEFAYIERLEGRICSHSQHAGGVVIYPNLGSILPLHTDSDDRNKRIISFDMDVLHEIGHFKFDCLGLKALTTLNMTVEYIRDFTGVDLHLDEIDYDDEEVYKDLCSGNVSGVFQLAKQQAKVVEQQPKNFADLIAINALIRPGIGDWEEYIARRNGKEWTCHPDRMPYLAETFGIITYQEQFLLDCKTFAGWSIAFADANVRKNKRIREDVDLRNKFIADGIGMGYSTDILEGVWKEIEDAVDGGYSFNKSHACSYAVVSFRTAYCKRYYPQYFYSALMTRVKDAQDADVKLASLVAECKQSNITILPPDINISKNNFIPESSGIRYPLTAIKGLGESAIEYLYKILPISSLDDLMLRAEKRYFKSNNVEAVIKAGCFDHIQPNRCELLNYFYEKTKSKKKCELKWCEDTKMQFEVDAFGLYLSKHPLEKYGFKSITEFPDGTYSMIAGIIIDIAEIFDKKGNKMAFVTISNQYENIKCLAFAQYWNDKKKCNKDDYKEGNLVMIKGKRSGKDCLINEMEVLEYADMC